MRIFHNRQSLAEIAYSPIEICRLRTELGGEKPELAKARGVRDCTSFGGTI
jgi:hypothetical protein